MATTYSEVSIANIALGLLGEKPIRDFDEDNARARICETYYAQVVGILLTKYDWNFARRYAELNQLALEDEDAPFGTYAYQLPDDCKIPRDIWPPGAREHWQLVGQKIMCELTEVGLFYTTNDPSVETFPDNFATLVAHNMAVRMCTLLTHDKQLRASLNEEYAILESDLTESDANIGSEYRRNDDNKNLDQFVDPDSTASSLLSRELPVASS